MGLFFRQFSSIVVLLGQVGIILFRDMILPCSTFQQLVQEIAVTYWPGPDLLSLWIQAAQMDYQFIKFGADAEIFGSTLELLRLSEIYWIGRLAFHFQGKKKVILSMK